MFRHEISVLWKRFKIFMDQFMMSRLGVFGLAILTVFISLSIFAPYLSSYSIKASEGNIHEVLKPPSNRHIFGTDELGRDVFTLIIHGGRISLLVGFLATIISGGLGALIGSIAGYFGSWLDDILMRITDLFLVIPGLPLMIVLSALLGRSIWNIIFVIGILSWTGTARVIRSQVMSIKEKPFIESVKAAGAGDLWVLRKHILPNVLPLIAAQMTLQVGGAILSESALSFLGLGDPTHVSWGMILHYAFSCGALSSGCWWYILPPGICIALVVLAFSFIGYAMDQIVNPRIRRR
ncbi:MAG: ABC transporter permease [archaeon GB-1867-035]|nr:ABC transporter permease [Candidatus Culexmicrobium profundum]